MMKTNIILVMAALVAASGAPAWAQEQAPAKQPYICLHHNEVDGWGARDKTSMIVNDRFGRKYLVSLGGVCSDLDFAFGMGIRPLGHVAMGCVDRGDRVVMGGGGASHVGMSSCFVTKVQLYTKDMQAADKFAREHKQPLAAY